MNYRYEFDLNIISFIFEVVPKNRSENKKQCIVQSFDTPSNLF